MTSLFRYSNEQPSLVTPSSKPRTSGLKYMPVLTIDPRNLDPEAEIRKLYGAQFASSSDARRKGMLGHRRYLLVTPKDTWPPSTEKPLYTMQSVRTRRNGSTVFKFVSTERAKAVHAIFLSCLETHSPDAIAGLLRSNPYHIESLLVLSEACRQTGDFTMASSLTEQALFSAECAFHPLFKPTTGMCRLRYNVRENRSFYMALHRYTQVLSRRGCWRTAFEYTKLLINLDHYDDPLGVWCCFDFYALKAEQYATLEKIWNVWSESHELAHLPSWPYSLALAKFHEECARRKTKSGNVAEETADPHQESSRLLHAAVIQYPKVLELIAQKSMFSFELNLETYKESEKLPAYKLLSVYPRDGR